jgi:hypothetical protein
MQHELEQTEEQKTVNSIVRTVEALVELQSVLRKALAASTERERLLHGENERLRAKCFRYEQADLERRRYEEEG